MNRYADRSFIGVAAIKKRSFFLVGLGAGFSLTSFMGHWRALRRARKKMGFGNYSCWEWFNQTFPCFVEKHAALEALRDKVFVRQIRMTPVDSVIFGLGRVCVEDYEQVLNLCGNGFGIGGMQILRGMYERQVTAAYLSKNPEEVGNFVDYTYVHMSKAVNQLKSTYRDRPDIFRRLVSEEEQKEVEEKFKALGDRFLETKCENCNTKKPMFSWTRLDPGSMALKGGQGLEGLHFYQYYRPTLLSHSTFKSIEARVVDRPDGSFFFDSEGSQRKYIPEALLGAHNLLVNVFDLHNKHFGLGLEAEVEACNKDYVDCWSEFVEAR